MGRVSQRRMERLKSLIKSALSDIIREELTDPRIGIFSLTEVRLAGDLSRAEVLVSVVGGAEESETCCEVLNSASPLLWNRLREQTDLRTVPQLRFTSDRGAEYAERINELLEQITPHTEVPAPTEEESS